MGSHCSWVCVIMLCIYAGQHQTQSRSLLKGKRQNPGLPAPETAAANADKLAVVILITDLHYKGSNRTTMLRGAIRLARANLFPTTPCVVYIFTLHRALPELASGLRDLLQPPDVQLLPVPEDAWRLPEVAADSKYWHGYWNGNYRTMGDWRLSYMPQFARDQGHRYVMQMDDNSYIISPSEHNLVELFDRDGYTMGAALMTHDGPQVTWGLPELTKHFLLNYGVQPATLFQHCKPPSVEGLYSAATAEMLEHFGELGKTLGSALRDPAGGWDRYMPSGNCVMFSLDWWFQPLVKRFVRLCRDSGGSVMHRWNDQAVMGMAMQVFVPDAQFRNLTFGYMHRGTAYAALTAAGLDPRA